MSIFKISSISFIILLSIYFINLIYIYISPSLLNGCIINTEHHDTRNNLKFILNKKYKPNIPFNRDIYPKKDVSKHDEIKIVPKTTEIPYTYKYEFNNNGLPKIMNNPAIVIIHYNRIHYLNQTIASLSKLQNIKDYKVYLSQDGPNSEAKKLAEQYKFTYIEHAREEMNGGGTSYLARHYKRALDILFLVNGHSHVIIAEDDMVFSPDFLDFFEATAPLLEADPTLWCASSWNDMGINNLVHDSKRMFRTDFFSGLGWMLTKTIWTELSPIFPQDQWDWWMRINTNSKDRECVVPEVSRNKNIGSEGVNVHAGPFYDYLASIAWVNSDSKYGLTRENGGFGDMTYLLKDNYEVLLKDAIDNTMRSFVQEKKVLSVPEINRILNNSLVESGYIGSINAGSVDLLNTLSSHTLKFSPENLVAPYNITENLFHPNSSVLLGSFNSDDFDYIKIKLGFEFLRSTHNGIVIVRIREHVLILANEKATYLPEKIWVNGLINFLNVRLPYLL